MVNRPRLAADGSRCVVWQDARTLVVHSIGAVAQSFPIPCEVPVLCAALSPNGKQLALCLKGGLWEAWDTTVPRRIRRFTELRDPPPGVGTDQPGQGLCMEFSPDGGRLAIGTDDWTTVSIWNTADWSQIQPPFTCGHGVLDVCFGSDGVLWSADWQGDCYRFSDPPYRAHESAAGPVRRPEAARLSGPAADCVVTPGGALIAAAGWNGTVRMFHAHRLVEGKLAQHGPDLKHEGEVASVDWSPDGRRLLTVSTAGEVNIWDRETGLLLFAWPQLRAVVQAGFAHGGRMMVLAGVDGVVRVREVHPGGRVGADWPDRLEKLSGYQVGDDGELLAIEADSSGR